MIEYNKVTSFSKLVAIILFILVVPVVSFYIGKEYQKVIHDLSKDATLDYSSVNLQRDKISQSVLVNNIPNYGNISFFKDGDNLYILNYNIFENEYSGVVTHVNLRTKTSTSTGSPYLIKKDGKLIGAKSYILDAIELKDSDGDFNGYTVDQTELQKVANEVGISKSDLKLLARGEKPVMVVLIEAEYDPSTKKLNLSKNQVKYPEYDYKTNTMTLAGEKYPGPEYVSLGETWNGVDVEKMGMKFVYSTSSKSLLISY